ncbi:MAG: hypothetical protein HYT79_07345 [Elusimicrobia bacterium]|nr:hypothetical protein [Elusimicrobiota bacterium]
MRMLLALLTLLPAMAAAGGQALPVSALAGPETAPAHEAMARFDGAPPPPPEAQAEPLAVNDNGVALISRHDEIIGERYRPGYYSCHGHHYYYPYPGGISYTHCSWVPPAYIQDHQETSQYKIVNRDRYVSSQTGFGAMIGSLAGGGTGLLIGLAVLSVAGGLGLLAIAAALAGAGAGIGALVARANAKSKPEEFTEIRYYSEYR